MKKILIASHGNLANGIKSSIDILIGNRKNIFYINAYIGDEDLDKDIDEFINNLQESDQVLIFTDLFGGSVNQKIFAKFSDKNAFIISGFNLAVILELILLDDELTLENVNEAIKNGREQLMLVPNKIHLDDNDDF